MSHRNCVYEIPESEFRLEAGLEELGGSRWHGNPRTCSLGAPALGTANPGIASRSPSQSFFTLARIQGLAGSELDKALLEEHNGPHQSRAGLAALVTESETTLME